MLITDFARKHEACQKGVEKALSLGCKTMAEVWAHPEFDAEDRIWAATRKGVLTDKELRLFAVSSARQVQHLMTDQRSIDALDVSERYAKGEATDEELAAARAASWAAARAASRAAALDTSWVASWDAARAASWAAALDTSWDTSWDAAWDASWAAALDTSWDAAWDASRDAQAKWLIENTAPRWEA